MSPHFDLIIIAAILIPMLGSAVLFSLVTIALLVARARIFHYRVYKPMLLNLALAWIPIICVGCALLIFLLQTGSGGISIWGTLILLVVWFVFFPNSTYLVTEFHHLKEDVNTVPFWFDTIVILSLALCGVILGSFSLLLVQRLLLFYMPEIYTWLILIVYLFVSNIGIYIGRFLRFNSWDILANPLGLAKSILLALKDKKELRNMLMFASLFTIFLLAFYLFLYSGIDPITRVLEALVRYEIQHH